MLKHIITIGLYDKDSHKQEISKPEAIDAIIDAINSRGLCATILTEGIYGVYQHDDGTRVLEPSIRVEIADVESAIILPMIHDLGARFNQESIMWETERKPIAFTHIEYK